MSNVLDLLKERGFIAQITHEEELREAFENGQVTFYTGYDATADSLHVGHFLQAVAMRHLQNAGHRPIVLIGGGTTMIGDPSGRSDMRKMLTRDDIAANAEVFKEQLSRFIDFSDEKAILVDNADWLLGLEYIPFLREIGTSFSVNRMLQAECYKSRLEGGLTFLEFNYMIMQAFDFLKLFDNYNCQLQMGGDDQWSNIIAGADLIRRKREGSKAFGMTFNLLTTSDGKKMGKTMAGALWLDRNKTTPYEFYQYWRNIEDASVEKCLALLTFLPMDEVRRLGALEGAEINKAKEILAFEVTKLVHSEEDAINAQNAARELFDNSKGANENAPTTEVAKAEIEKGLSVIEALKLTGLAKSNSEARTLIEQGGVSLNEIKITDIGAVIGDEHINGDIVLIKKGKKSFHQIKLV